MTQRSWCFTINNYTLDEQLHLEEIECRYMIYGLEVGAEGTPHIQGYIEFGKPVRFNTAKRLIGDRCHLEQRRGTREQARNYCMKDNEYIETGNWEAGGMGRRTDLDHYRDVGITDGMRAVTATANLQQIKVVEKFLTYNEEPRDFKPEVTWIHGETGTGKSRTAREISINPDDTYTKNCGTKWWDGYDAHETVIIDDFRDSWWSLTEMLSLLDRYEKRVEFKGGYRQFKPKQIIITSIKSPNECYSNCGEDVRQLLRRIDTVTMLRNEVGGVILDAPLL